MSVMWLIEQISAVLHHYYMIGFLQDFVLGCPFKPQKMALLDVMECCVKGH